MIERDRELLVLLEGVFVSLGYDVKNSLATKLLVEKGVVKGHVSLCNPCSVTGSPILVSLGNYKHNFRRSVYIEENQYDESMLLSTLKEIEGE